MAETVNKKNYSAIKDVTLFNSAGMLRDKRLLESDLEYG